MRTAILGALLVVAPFSIYAASQATQQPAKPAAQADPQQDPKKAPGKPASPPESGSPLLPPATSGNPAKPATPEVGVPPSDPTKLGAGPSGTAGAMGAKPAAPVNTKTYVIGAEDEISIVVFENPQFNVPVVSVRPDGKVVMPLLGELQAAGKSPEELTKEITENLTTNYMNITPHVYVNVIKVMSKNYYINGEVGRPGKYPLVVPTKVSQALVQAGGFKDFANKKDVRIQRGAKTFHFNFNEVSKGKKLDQDIYLEPDDQIYIR
jgi:polysaccharide export outer membrane protein